jgi:hypothetical protein
MAEQGQAAAIIAELQPGDRLRVIHEVRVGFRRWVTETEGTVVAKQRRRHGLHFDRNPDDKVFSDVLLLRKDDGELTEVTLDEFTKLIKLASQAPQSAEAPS